MKTKTKTKTKNIFNIPTAAEASYGGSIAQEPQAPAPNPNPNPNPERVVPIHTIRDRATAARDLANLIHQYALEAVLHARDALKLSPSDFTAAMEGYFDDDEEPKHQLATKLVTLLDWSSELKRALDGTVVDLYQHDNVAKEEAAIRTEEWKKKNGAKW